MNYSWWLSFCQVPPTLNYTGTDSIVFGLYRPLPLPFLLLDVYLWTISLLIRVSGGKKKYFEETTKVKLRFVILYLLVVLIKSFMGYEVSKNQWDAVWTMLSICGFYYSLCLVSFILEHLGFSHRESWLRKQNLSLIFLSYNNLKTCIVIVINKLFCINLN